MHILGNMLYLWLFGDEVSVMTRLRRESSSLVRLR